jgi:hypothetical protein
MLVRSCIVTGLTHFSASWVGLIRSISRVYGRVAQAREFGFGMAAFGLGLGDPSGHDGGVGACVQCGSVLVSLVSHRAMTPGIWSA